ncbi:hypothetical protein RB195_015910 [Necator americanus]|uniref:Uncharacterized protein n=1 Tax=Necator americanus TaxID=51031 RepID=A0ABR1E6N7_NECAM
MRWEACRIQLSLIVIVANILLLVESLKCLSGFEGSVIKVVEQNDASKFWMCAYETMVPCDFKEKPRTPNFRAAELKAKVTSCFGQRNRAICYCSSDFCNQNYTVFLKKWIHSHVSNQTLFNCVKEHIEEKANDQNLRQSSTSRSIPVAISSSPHTHPRSAKSSTALSQTSPHSKPLRTSTRPPPSSRQPPPTTTRLTHTTPRKTVQHNTTTTSGTKKTTRRPAQTTGTPKKRTTNDKSGDGENTNQTPDSNFANSGKSGQRPIDYEPFDRRKSDTLIFVIIAVGAAILVCLIAPAVIYVVKNRKVQKKDLMRARRGRRFAKQGRSPANMRKPGSVRKQ